MAALATVVALTGFYIPPVQFVTNFIWLVPIIAVAVRRDFNTGMLSLITTAILLMILVSPWRALVFLVQFAGLGVVYSYCFAKKEEFSKTILLGTVVVAISTIISFGISFMFMGMNFADISAAFEQNANDVFAIYERTGIIDRLVSQGISISEVKESIMNVSQIAAKVIPAAMVIYGMVVAFITYFVTRNSLQKLKLPISELPKFRNWQIPWYFVWGVILGIALMLYGDFKNWEIGLVLGMNIMYGYLPILFIQGLSVVTYFYLRWKISILLRVILLGIIVVNFPVTLMLLLFIGLFDPLFNYRKIGQIRKDKDENLE